MCTYIHDLTIIQHHDLIRMPDRRNSLRYDNLGRIRQIFGKCFLDYRISLRINRTGRIIEDQYLRFLKECSRNTKTLLLSTGDICSSLLNVGIISIRHRLNEFIRTGKATGFFYFFIRRLFISPAEVLFYCS